MFREILVGASVGRGRDSNDVPGIYLFLSSSLSCLSFVLIPFLDKHPSLSGKMPVRPDFHLTSQQSNQVPKYPRTDFQDCQAFYSKDTFQMHVSHPVLNSNPSGAGHMSIPEPTPVTKDLKCCGWPVWVTYSFLRPPCLIVMGGAFPKHSQGAFTEGVGMKERRGTVINVHHGCTSDQVANSE